MDSPISQRSVSVVLLMGEGLENLVSFSLACSPLTEGPDLAVAPSAHQPLLSQCGSSRSYQTQD